MRYDLNRIQHLNAKYDTCSVMHYNAYAFSKNNKPTITRLSSDGGKCKLGQREGFSDTDIRKINTLYSCTGYPQTSGGKPGIKPTVTPTVKPDLSCQDNNQYCATWAQMEECQKNPGWMLKNCPVSCKECDNKCADHNVNCGAWKGQGECSKNADYMNVYCRASCGKCTPSGGNCKNDKGDCEGWAGKGYCTKSKYKKFMELRCKKACGLC